MADKDQENTNNGGETTADKQPRRIRKVETVREKVEKTEEQRIGIGTVIWRGFTAPLGWIGRGVARLGRNLGEVKVLHVISLILWPRYFRNSWRELRQVTWTNGKQSRQLTTAVVLFATIFGVLIALLDFGLDKVFKQVLLK